MLKRFSKVIVGLCVVGMLVLLSSGVALAATKYTAFGRDLNGTSQLKITQKLNSRQRFDTVGFRLRDGKAFGYDNKWVTLSKGQSHTCKKTDYWYIGRDRRGIITTSAKSINLSPIRFDP